VAVAEELGDDGGADQAGATGDEDAHATLLDSDGTLVPLAPSSGTFLISASSWWPDRRR
jgi:hypothetical protein